VGSRRRNRNRSVQAHGQCITKRTPRQGFGSSPPRIAQYIARQGPQFAAIALVFCPMLWSTKGLTPEQRAEADYLFSQWCKRYPGASWRTLNALYGAAARWAVHGPLPNRNQRLGLRTAKRRREWAEKFPGIPYPGTHGARSLLCRRRNHAACTARDCACKCHK